MFIKTCDGRLLDSRQVVKCELDVDAVGLVITAQVVDEGRSQTVEICRLQQIAHARRLLSDLSEGIAGGRERFDVPVYLQWLSEGMEAEDER